MYPELSVTRIDDFGIHPGHLRAGGLGEGAAGGYLFVGDPLMGPAIGAVLTLSCWIRQVVLRGHQPADRRADQAVRYGLSCTHKISLSLLCCFNLFDVCVLQVDVSVAFFRHICSDSPAGCWFQLVAGFLGSRGASELGRVSWLCVYIYIFSRI